MTHLGQSSDQFDLSFLDDVAKHQQTSSSTRTTKAASPNAPPKAAPTRAAPTSGMPRPEDIPTGTNLTPPNTQKSLLPRNERIEKLNVLAGCVAGCVRCPELAETRQQTVFGTGNPEAAIMFIGEAPGADEDRQGEPFVGRSGQLLNKIIAACRLTREEIYIANVLKCRPPANRTPSPQEAENCREYLTAQIAIVDPDYIVCWGKPAVEDLLGTKTPLGRLRRQFFPYGRAKVAATYHPSYLLRYPSKKNEVWGDMIWLFVDMGVDLGK